MGGIPLITFMFIFIEYHDIIMLEIALWSLDALVYLFDTLAQNFLSLFPERLTSNSITIKSYYQ